MAMQIRDKILPFRGSCKGKNVWIVGSGSSLDLVDVSRLGDEYIIALNSAYTLFVDRAKFPNAWLLFYDVRMYGEIKPYVDRIPYIKAFVHKKSLEDMRQLKNSGRYVEYDKRLFMPKRTVFETALIIADYLGFDRAYTIGVDGFVPNGQARPYCREVNTWKTCRFMDKGKPKSHEKSTKAFLDEVKNVLPRLNNLTVINTSPYYPDRDMFTNMAFDDAVMVSRDAREKIKRKPRKPVRQGKAI